VFISFNHNWILGVVGCWQGAGEAGRKPKVSTQKSPHTSELILILWAKKIAQTPKHLSVLKFTTRPSSFKKSIIDLILPE
jgi:hypothetical protein